MPVNKNALIRYKTIDLCLRNRQRRWTLENLIQAVSDALYEYEGIDKGISKRSIQADIQFMRSDKLGYNAPIVIVNKKYYTYEDPNYSIINIPLNPQDLNKMSEAVEVLKQFRGFSHFYDLHEIVQKLEDHVYTASHNTSPIIDFEKNDDLKGLEYLGTLYNAIIQKKVLMLTYQSFKAKAAETFAFHGWWLKEYKNRWFVVGIRKEGGMVLNLALDRLHQVTIDETLPYIPANTNAQEYYKDVVGVTVSHNVRPSTVQLFVSKTHAPYVETKPLHPSQIILEETEEGIVIQLEVQINYELEKEILGFGDGMIVIAPGMLKRKISERMKLGYLNYERELNNQTAQ
ncbi:putative DNA-binding transcriptional regulator YafY [Chitinophaga skermanii]|uniref:Putative DNA-binding transcriptional regulator YafY n=1 Tax=Chitinophaga skermanii TaxID=331697 RepID=A0A327QI93_9BACT|nr:WYL domain-containing protein [Chitinophaga skermanii]RAJ04289.1 putative DNA-binding transcriptional regulator YafY [Chitinophaga skermanii]